MQSFFHFFSGDLSAFSFDYCQKPYMVSSTSLALFLSVTLYILKKLINNSRGKYKRNECLINVCKSDTDLS